MKAHSLVGIAVVPFALCSCGVAQLATESDEDRENSTFMMALAPVLLITGDYPDTTAKNFKPFSYDAGLIRARDSAVPNSKETDEILAAMDRCFRMSSVKRMPETEVYANFGPADQRFIKDGQVIYVYRIQRTKGQPERWLVHE